MHPGTLLFPREHSGARSVGVGAGGGLQGQTGWVREQRALPAVAASPQVPPGGAAGSRTNQRRPASGTFPSLGPCPPPEAEPGRRQLTVESGAHPPITGTRARLSLSGLRGAPRGAWGACPDGAPPQGACPDGAPPQGACPDGAPPPGSTPACCSCPSASRSGAAPRSFSRSSRTPRPAATPS